MARVKGSKQYQMVVVPHRPHYRFMIFIVFVSVVLGFGWFSFEFGKFEGNELESGVIGERDRAIAQLADSEELIDKMRQEIADLRVGGQISEQANEEVRQTIEQLQGQIAELNEEIRFYKGVMMPSVAVKGLRIERLDMSTIVPGRVKYSLLLTQVVDKHDFVNGDVDISVLGKVGDQELQLSLIELQEEKEASLRFRFRYFQNLHGEMVIPDDFEPREVIVIAQSSGTKGQRSERAFDWPLNGG